MKSHPLSQWRRPWPSARPPPEILRKRRQHWSLNWMNWRDWFLGILHSCPTVTCRGECLPLLLTQYIYWACSLLQGQCPSDRERSSSWENKNQNSGNERADEREWAGIWLVSSMVTGWLCGSPWLLCLLCIPLTLVLTHQFCSLSFLHKFVSLVTVLVIVFLNHHDYIILYFTVSIYTPAPARPHPLCTAMYHTPETELENVWQ